MAEKTDVNKYLISIPKERGKQISFEDCSLINSIARAAFYSALKKENYYTTKDKPVQSLHIEQPIKDAISAIENKQAKKTCQNIIKSLENKFYNFEIQKRTLSNLWYFAEFSLKNGRDFIFDQLLKENKILDWEKLEDKLITDGYNFKYSELYNQFLDKANEYSIKYKNAQENNLDDKTTLDKE